MGTSGFDDEDLPSPTTDSTLRVGHGHSNIMEGGCIQSPLDHLTWPLGPAPAENPKEKAGRAKPSLFSVIPTAALLHLGEVMKLGAKKYGPFNWRETRVPAITYVDAAGRHLLSWLDGESEDPESGMSHLAHIMACCAILIDAQENGMLDDNRPKAGRTGEMITNFQQTGKFNPEKEIN